jgi:hypothetical protein
LYSPIGVCDDAQNDDCLGARPEIEAQLALSAVAAGTGNSSIVWNQTNRSTAAFFFDSDGSVGNNPTALYMQWHVFGLLAPR